jgi:nucleotide-binding universal stress UspA family protein
MLERMHFLCAVDESTSARPVAHFAGQLAERLGAELTLMRVVAPGAMPAPAGATTSGIPLSLVMETVEAQAARRDLDVLADDLAAALGIRARLRVETGKPVERLLAAANASEYDLVVIGQARRGRPVGAARGSTSDRLIEGARSPVLAVPTGQAALATGRVVVAYDGPRPPRDVLVLGARVAPSLGIGITVVDILANPRAYPGPAWSTVQARRRAIEAVLEPDVADIRYATAYGRPAAALAQSLAEIRPAMVITGPGTLRQPSHPVMVVPAGSTTRWVPQLPEDGAESPQVACR